jgi:hypothetical protein
MIPPHALVPLPVLAAAMRTRRFWISVARHSVPLVGVFAFRWSPMNLAIFFLLESWLYITMRLTVEVTFDPHYAGSDLPTSAWDALRKTVWMGLMASIAAGVLVFGFGGFIIVAAFPEDAWSAFLAHDVRRTSFRIGLAALAIDILVEGVVFHRRLLQRSAAEKRADDLRVKVMFYRVVALLMAFMILGLASQIGLGGYVLVVAIMVILVYFDVFPRRALKTFD